MPVYRPKIWKSSPEYQMRVSHFCAKDGLAPPAIATVVFSQKEFERSHPRYAKQFRGIPALSLGLLTPSYAILGRFASTPVGLIAFEDVVENSFGPGEKEFILAHEYSHIVKNHCPLKLLGKAASSFVDDYISELENDTSRTIVQIAWQYFGTVVGAGFTRNSEIEADIHATQLIGSRTTAVATIEKLAQEFAGGDMSQPTHFIVKNGRKIPVLTFAERLAALRNCITLGV